jgi:hypothetical protein
MQIAALAGGGHGWGNIRIVLLLLQKTGLRKNNIDEILFLIDGFVCKIFNPK